ncbi:hypothetical protein GGR92_000422 [Spirosoma lacussanchae]
MTTPIFNKSLSRRVRDKKRVYCLPQMGVESRTSVRFEVMLDIQTWTYRKLLEANRHSLAELKAVLRQRTADPEPCRMQMPG